MNNKILLEFTPQLHKKYLYFILNKKMPSVMSSMDTNRSLLVYFALSGLDVLNEVDNISRETKQNIIEWIYSLQVVDEKELASGFQGSTSLNTIENKDHPAPYKWSHIASTFSCLASLLILGDDLTRVKKREILNSLKILQLPNGCFKGAIEGVEDDMRFVFCAASICYILNDWSTINIDLLVKYIINSISYDGGIGQGPGLESHCGSTFCALATLKLSKNLDKLSKAQFKAVRRWLLARYESGFNGRPNKPVDTCYSFWTGGALKILQSYGFIEEENNNQFVLMTQDRYGGFSKWVNSVPDPLHTYFGLAGLSMMELEGLAEMHCELTITMRAHEHLLRLQQSWN